MNFSNVHASSLVGIGVLIDTEAYIGPNCHLEGSIEVESGAILKGGITFIGDIVVGRGSIIEPGVCIAAPLYERVAESTVVHVGNNVHVGAGTVLLKGVTIGHHAWIEPGTVVTQNIPSYAIVGGNPAKITGYVGNSSYQLNNASTLVAFNDKVEVYPSSVQGVTVHHYARISDLRGDLSVGEFERSVPFQPKRFFIVYDVPSAETRGQHAHMKCQQFLICVAGSVSVVVDDGEHREEVLLNRPNIGLFIPAGIWGIQYKYSTNGTLLVFASEYYDASDYIRNYDNFLKYRKVSS
jgi:UDP-2-acetamido-3-amino-2,3-dideoxy-glucuronate N-acetyltransferase